MKRFFWCALALVAWIAIYDLNIGCAEVAWQEISRGINDIESVLVDSYNSDVIYVGTQREVLKSIDAGKNWKSILSVKGQNKRINFLFFDPQDRNLLFAATGSGLFYSCNQGSSWKLIFKGKNYLERDCVALATLPGKIYLGTRQGFFSTQDCGRSWRRVDGKLARGAILAIALNYTEPKYMYVACQSGVFRSMDGGISWEQIMPVLSADKDNDDTDAEAQDGAQQEDFSFLTYLSVDPQKSGFVYLATTRGVYHSRDYGQTWEALTSYGLLSQRIEFISIFGQSRLYAATRSGIFEYRSLRWEEVSLRLAAEEINSLAIDKQGVLYAATDKGLFKTMMLDPKETTEQRGQPACYKGQPNIRQVQDAAIKYAEVEPEKIMRWRKQAAKKAWLPQLNVGADRNASDLWHWEGGSTTKADDDTLRRGRDCVEWDVSLTWDLSRLIWSDDQISIDTRSRLSAQLRDDVVSEVTKLYFERIRLITELNNLSIEEIKKRMDKELRISEVTALLDGLTNGFFSRFVQ